MSILTSIRTVANSGEIEFTDNALGCNRRMGIAHRSPLRIGKMLSSHKVKKLI